MNAADHHEPQRDGAATIEPMARVEDADQNLPLFPVGTKVRVLPKSGRNTPREGEVERAIYHHKDRRWNYYLRCGGKKVSKRYVALDLKRA